MQIPEIIHSCWFGGNQKTALHIECEQTWTVNLPNYTFIEWTEENVDTEDPFIAFHLKKKHWAFVSDYVRLLALFEHGGIYLDSDMEVIREIDVPLNTQCFLGWESSTHLNGSVIGATPKHPYIAACIDYIAKRHNSHKRYKVIPNVLTDVYKSTFHAAPGIHLFPTNAFYPYNPFLGERRQLMYKDVSSNTFAIHHWSHTWKFSLTEKIANRLRSIVYGK